MAIRIDIDSFVPDPEQSDHCLADGHTDGLVTVEIEGRARSCEARIHARGFWIIRGLLVTYPGTTKSWSAALYYMPQTELMWVRPNYTTMRHPMPMICGFVEDLHDEQVNAGRKRSSRR